MNQALLINQTKTTEAISLILKLHQKPIILNRLLKMLYFIDQLYLAQSNQSLTKDSFQIKSSGLIPKYSRKLIQQLKLNQTLIVPSTGSGHIALNHYPRTENLTTLEQEIVSHIYHQKKSLNPFNILDWNYDLQFLRKHLREKQRNLITPLDILQHLGKTKEEISVYTNQLINETNLQQDPVSLPNNSNPQQQQLKQRLFSF